jgi:hypothetical protein
MTTGRFRAAAVIGALLATGLPLVAGAVAPHLTCGVPQRGSWETIKVREFQPVSGLSAPDVVTAYGLDTDRPQDVVVTNGVRLQLSETHGCDWTNGFALDPGVTGSQTFPGATSSIVSVGTSKAVVLAAVQEGSGAAGRPHVVRFSGGAWATVDSGLPAQGSPRLLRLANDGRTAYLTVSPTATGGSDTNAPAPLPTLPPLPLPVPVLGDEQGASTALLYATEDAGLTWALRTDPTALPAGGQGFTDLVVDPANPAWLYGIAGGTLLVSRNGGASFTAAPGVGYTAVVPYFGMVVAFTADGRGVLSPNGQDFVPLTVPKGITSAATRGGDSSVLLEINGALSLLMFDGTTVPVPAATPARTATLLGDTGVQSSFHVLSGHALLRYVDPVPKDQKYPPIAVGDRSLAPPVPGTVSPAEREITLRVGARTTAAFELDLPKNPTPLDLFFLVDVSGSMATYIDDLKQNIHKVVDRLERAHINLKVGVGTLGTGPAEGEAPYPESYVYPPTGGTSQPYRKPRVYERIRGIGDTGDKLRQAINSIRLETPPPRSPGDVGTFHEGQLLALEQMVTGSGLQTEQEARAGLNTYSAVTPGQDAGWRENPDVRRIVVVASDEAFDVPYGTPQEPESTVAQPLLDYRRTLGILNKARIGVFGITAGSPDSLPDMTELARGTGTLTPPGGVSCGGDPEQVLPAGAPLVCSQEGDFSTIIAQVLASLTDVQDVHLRPSAATPVLTGVHGERLLGLDVKRANRATFRLDLSCVGAEPGSYAFEVEALLRQYPVGATRVRVNCVGPQAAVPPLPLPPVVRPPLAPAVQPPPPPPAPPPAAQPQPQPQPNVNPLTAAAMQEEQQAQLALALNQTTEPEEQQGTEQLAMVDRRHRQEVQAFGSLLVAMTACAGLGLARLRGRPQVATRPAR